MGMFRKRVNRPRILAEMVVFLTAAIVMPNIIDRLLGETMVSACISYAVIPLVILLYLTLSGERPTAYLRLGRFGMGGVLKGIGLGVFLLLIQLAPLLAMGMDIRTMAQPPQWSHILTMSAFCLLFVGPSEELLMRGFLLHKSEELTGSRLMALLLNCLFFYIFHWPPLPFVFGQFFNLALNTMVLCVFFYLSKRQSIVPLMIAHGVYDVLMLYLLPVILYYLPW